MEVSFLQVKLFLMNNLVFRSYKDIMWMDQQNINNQARKCLSEQL